MRCSVYASKSAAATTAIHASVTRASIIGKGLPRQVSYTPKAGNSSSASTLLNAISSFSTSLISWEEKRIECAINPPATIRKTSRLRADQAKTS